VLDVAEGSRRRGALVVEIFNTGVERINTSSFRAKCRKKSSAGTATAFSIDEKLNAAVRRLKTSPTIESPYLPEGPVLIGISQDPTTLARPLLSTGAELRQNGTKGGLPWSSYWYC
jgi:hypothetical protein